MKRFKKKWLLVILFLGLIIIVWKFLAKEGKVSVKEDLGIEILGVSERIVVYGEDEGLERWPKDLYANIGEFNILVAGEFFILFADQENNNEIDEIKESIYSKIEQYEKVPPSESFLLVFNQKETDGTLILRMDFKYGQGKLSQRPATIYYFTITHNRPPLNLKNSNMNHDKPYKTIDIEPFTCYVDDIEKTIKGHASRYNLGQGVGIDALRKELHFYAEKVAKEFFELVKDKI